MVKYKPLTIIFFLKITILLFLMIKNNINSTECPLCRI